MLDVCVCTHNPRRPLLDAVIASIVAQTAPAASFRVTVIDNASEPPISPEALDPLTQRGVTARVISEPRTGLMHARISAINATDGNWMLFVDDDNVLAPDFIENGLAFIAAHPEVGAVGGRLLLPGDIAVPEGREPFLPFLGIRDLGDQPVIGRSPVWVEHEPAGAGAFVRRDVLVRFEQLTKENPEAFALGRSGGSLASCDDSLLMSCADQIGLALAYAPTLRLDHHIAHERFNLGYLRRLMAAYGESQVTLQYARSGHVEVPRYYASTAFFALMIIVSFLKNAPRSLAFAQAQTGYHLAARRAFGAAAHRQRAPGSA